MDGVSNLSDVRPRSAPALEVISRAESSVGVIYHSSGPNTGRNPGGGQIQKNLLYLVVKTYTSIYAVDLTSTTT